MECVVRTLKICPRSKFQSHNTVLLTVVVTMLCIISRDIYILKPMAGFGIILLHWIVQHF